MEKEAKELSPDWQGKLSKMRQKQLKSRENRLQEFEKLCNSIDSLDGEIIIRQKGNSTIKNTILQLLKELRWGEDFIGILLTHIRLKNLNRKSLEDKDNDITQSEHTPIYNDDIDQLFEQIDRNMGDIDTPNEDGENGLIVAIKKKKKLAVELLLMNGASIMHINNEDETAFEVGIDVGEEAINQVLWKHAKDNQEQYELFYNLCDKGNIEAVHFCIENSSAAETKQLIEWTENEKKLFPLLGCICANEIDVAKVLINKHFELNEKFLCECEVTGYNALIWSSQNGYVEIVELLLPIYIKYKQVSSKNNLGCSALSLAYRNGHTSIAKLLETAETKLRRKKNWEKKVHETKGR